MNDERFDAVNENLRLFQKKDGLTFGTDAYLLYAYMKKIPGGSACDLGAGTGIISLLAAVKNKFDRLTCVEIQKDFADLIAKNAETNGLSDKIDVFEGDLRDFRSKKHFDAVFTNPPYMKAGSGQENAADSKNAARRELNGGIEDFCRCAADNLKTGGLFYCVFRAERLPELFAAMQTAGIEPKALTLVFPDAKSRPTLVLVKGKRGAKPSLFVTPPLILFEDASVPHPVYTQDLSYIYEHGEFDGRFSAP